MCNKKLIKGKAAWKRTLLGLKIKQVDIVNDYRWKWGPAYLNLLIAGKRPIGFKHAAALSAITGIAIERIYKPITNKI